MIFRNRALARVGAGFAGLLAAGVIAAPAYADGADLAVEIAGTTIAANADGKIGEIDLKNVGGTTPESVNVIFDISKLEMDKVEFAPICDDDPADGKIVCPVAQEYIPAPGGTTDLGFLLTRAEDASGEAGEFTVTIEAEGDANEANDTDTAKVNVGASGVDLNVLVEDIKFSVNGEGDVEDTLVQPGGTTAVVGFILNQGDMTAKGLKISVTLPEHATFAEVEEGCTYTADNRTVTCEYADAVLIPADKDDTKELEKSGGPFGFLVKIDPNVSAPVSLKDGTASAFALGAEPFQEEQTERASAADVLPGSEELLKAEEVKELVEDVDPTDNTDTYTIFVGAKAGTGDGGSGGGGSLPVTGVQAGVIGGVGLGVLAVGGVLFMLARRRRVVLVTPADEKPTA